MHKIKIFSGLLRLGAAMLALLLPVARAGTFTSDFNSGWPPGATLWGTAYVDFFGGVGDSGALKLTDEFFTSQQGSFIVDDLDGGEMVRSFTAQFQMFIGSYFSVTNGADGLSFNFAADLPDDSFGEEGAGTGLTISFDTFNNGGGEAPAIDIRNGGVTLASLKGNLELFRTSSFIPVLVQAYDDGSLDLTVNGTPVVTHLAGAFTPSAGRFGFGARTGARWDNHHLDDLSITTTTGLPPHPIVVSAGPIGIGVHEDAAAEFSVRDRLATVVPGSIKLTLNGAAVSPSVSKSGDITSISYDPPGQWASGSSNVVTLSLSDTSGAVISRTIVFNVRYYLGPTGNIYEMVKIDFTWEEANIDAQSRNYHGRPGHLATLTSYEEDVFANKVRTTSFPNTSNWEVWIGGFQAFGSAPKENWFWVNNEGPISGEDGGATYSNWHGTEPNDYYGPDSENYLTLGLNGVFRWNDSGYYGTQRLGAYIVEYEALPIAMEIKHGDRLKVVDVQDEGKLFVALFSAADFDARKADLKTVRFGRTGTEAAPVSSKIQDLNGDKRPDLLVEFNIQDTGWRCDDVVGRLTGRTLEGVPFRSSAPITLRGCPAFSLQMAALQDVQQHTDIALAISPLIPGIPVPPSAEKVQLKSYQISGILGWTKNEQTLPLEAGSGGTRIGRLAYDDLSHFQKIEGALKVLNPKSKKKEVLRGETRVLFRPDPAVVSVSAPEQANAFQSFNIVAGVFETKGDLGAKADAFLMEGDTVIDSIPGFSIEAGGNVGLVFQARYTTPGVRALRVVIANVSPGDYDLSNNQASFNVEIVQPPVVGVPYYAYYDHTDAETTTEWDDYYSTGSSHETFKGENFNLTLTLPSVFNFPVPSLAFRIVVDGTERLVVFQENVDGYFYDYGCDQYYNGFADLGDGFYAYLNAYRNICWGYEQSSLSIQRTPYRQTYFSSVFDKFSGETYVNNYSYGYGTFLDVADGLAMRTVIDIGSGKYGGDASISELFSYPYDSFYEDVWDGGYYRYIYHADTVSGYNSGETVP